MPKEIAKGLQVKQMFTTRESVLAQLASLMIGTFFFSTVFLFPIVWRHIRVLPACAGRRSFQAMRGAVEGRARAVPWEKLSACFPNLANFASFLVRVGASPAKGSHRHGSLSHLQPVEGPKWQCGPPGAHAYGLSRGGFVVPISPPAQSRGGKYCR